MSTATTPASRTGWEPGLPGGDTLCLRWVRHNPDLRSRDGCSTTVPVIRHTLWHRTRRS